MRATAGPAVVAAHKRPGWMLMRDFGEHSLDGEPITRWQAANRAFATIQVGRSANLEPWWRARIFPSPSATTPAG
jgi:hypothetical protein